MVDDNQIKEIIAFLKSKDVVFEKGLSDLELNKIEKLNGFIFPPDLRLFLQVEVPISDKFVNWRSISENELNKKLSWPYDGICFDIEYNNFWMEEFGAKPDSLKESFEVVKDYLRNVPKLIPIYSHRYLPDDPNEVGNPILSVYQTDIIYYGSDLYNYFKNEFFSFGWDQLKFSKEIKTINFWSKVIEKNIQK